jgi:SAM-dependent methyltransferase
MASKFDGNASKEAALSIGLLAARHFLGIEDLHYGYWPEGLAVEIGNLKAAQAAFTELILANIPPGVKTVLDVGCGSGSTSVKLTAAGYTPSCVSPNKSLGESARRALGPTVEFFECPFEEFSADRRYDLILFSESFQYMKPEVALPKCAELLGPGGHVLICDFFRLPTEGKAPMGGGRPWERFQGALQGSPFRCTTDLDITPRTAPTVKLVADAGRSVLEPAYHTALAFLRRKFRLLAWLLEWMFAEKVRRSQFGRDWTVENFARHKTYRLLLLQKVAPAAARPPG